LPTSTRHCHVYVSAHVADEHELWGEDLSKIQLDFLMPLDTKDLNEIEKKAIAKAKVLLKTVLEAS
jgi:hypothetical protein